MENKQAYIDLADQCFAKLMESLNELAKYKKADSSEVFIEQSQVRLAESLYWYESFKRSLENKNGNR